MIQKAEETSMNLQTFDQSGFSLNRTKERKATLQGCQKGDFEVAKAHVKTLTSRYVNGEEVPWNVDVQHFKQYGTGVYLFFHLTKRLALVFGIFAIITFVPVVINSLNGDAFSGMIKTMGIYFARTTVGNLNPNPNGPSTIDNDTSRKYKLENAIPDLAICFAFIIFYVYWEVKSDRLTDQLKGEVKLQCHRSLQVKEFPPNTTEEQVSHFFSQFGKVKEVSSVQNYSDLLEQAKDIYDLSQKKKELVLAIEEEGDQADPKETLQRQQKIKDYESRIADMENHFAFDYKEGSNQALKFFVIFEETAGRQLAIKTLQGYSWRCRRGGIPEQHLLNGQLVKVSACHNEPGDIIWENLHITWRSRLIRGLAQGFLLILVLVATFLVISLLNIATPSTSTYLDVSHYDQNTIFNTTNSTIIYVWCIDYKDYMTVYPRINTLCSPYITRYYISIAIGILISCVVVGVKFLLKKIVVFLAKFQRYHGQTEQSIGIMRNLFYSYVCTTILITLLLQADIFGLSFKQGILTLISNGYLQDNGALLLSFSDFVPFWYVDIGYKLNLTLIIMALQAPLMTPLLLWIKEKLRQWWAKKQVTQRRMEEVLMPQNFEIEEHYANTLLIIYMACSFSSGMPLILVPCGLALVFRYFTYKILFLRYNLTPPALDEALNESVINLMPFAMLFHFCFGIWMFSTSSIFAHETSFVSDMLTSTSSFSRNVGQILMRLGDTWYFTLSFFLCVAVVIIKIFFYDFIYETYKAKEDELHPISVKRIQVQPIEGSIVDHNLLLNSYRIESNPKYSEILGIMKRLKEKNN